MPFEKSRKIFRVGHSWVVAVPDGWAEFLGIKRGTKVKVLANGVLVILPPNASPETVEKFKKIILEGQIWTERT